MKVGVKYSQCLPDTSWVSAASEPTIPVKCPGCSATTIVNVWWCPQCYLDFRPESPAEEASVPVQRKTDRPAMSTTESRASYRLSKQSALDVALAVEQNRSGRHAAEPDPGTEQDEAAELADRMLVDLAAELPASGLLVQRDAKQKVIIGVVATVVLMVLVLGVLTLLGLLA